MKAIEQQYESKQGNIIIFERNIKFRRFWTVEIQNKFNVVNHKLETLTKELENERKEFADLQEKYAEKVRYGFTKRELDLHS